MKKKVLAMLMAACMVIGMTACGSSDGGTKENAADVTGKTEIQHLNLKVMQKQQHRRLH